MNLEWTKEKEEGEEKKSGGGESAEKGEEGERVMNEGGSVWCKR